MSTVNKGGNGRRPIPSVGGAQQPKNQQNPDRQNQQNGGGNGRNKGNGGGMFDKSAFDAPRTKVPYPGINIDLVGGAPTGENKFLVARWAAEKAQISTPVKIEGLLKNAVDGSVVIQIVRTVGNDSMWVTSVEGIVNKGIVSASWLVNDNVNDWSKAVYTFTIVGCGGEGNSTNHLKIHK